MSSIGWLDRDGGSPIRLQLKPGCRVAPDAEPGLWLEIPTAMRVGGGFRVSSLIPTVFDRYARVLHPAKDRLGVLVPWRQVAEATGRVMHPEVQWEPLRSGPLGAVPDHLVSPWDSHTHGLVTASLVRVLFGGSPPKACWSAIWRGCAGVEEAFDAPLLRRGIRDYLLFRTTPDAVDDPFLPRSGPMPGLWWPDDRSFCVVKDTDLCWSYVGGSHHVIEGLLNDGELEVLEAEPDHRVDYLSDTVNGPVKPTYE